MRLRDRVRARLGFQTSAHVAADSADANALAAAPRGAGGGTGILTNLLSGINTSEDQAWWDTWFQRRTLTDEQRSALGADPLVRRILRLPGDDATREGWDVKVSTKHPLLTDAQVSEAIADYERREGIDLASRLRDASIRRRQHGAALILLGIDDGLPMDQPVDLDKIRRIWWTAVIDWRDFEYGAVIGPRGEVQDWSTIGEKDKEKFAPGAHLFGQVASYKITDLNGVLLDGVRDGDAFRASATATLNSTQITVHADRVLYLPYDRALPLLDQLQDSLAAYFRGMSGLTRAIDRASLFVWRVANHVAQSWSENHGIGARRIRDAMKSWSAMSAIVIDKTDEDITALGSGSSAGLGDALTPIMHWICAASGIPATRLFGTSPGGFGSGEGERADYNDSIRALQGDFSQYIRKFARYALASADGLDWVVPSGAIDIVWEDLDAPTDTERAALLSTNASTAIALMTAGFFEIGELRALMPEIELDRGARETAKLTAHLAPEQIDTLLKVIKDGVGIPPAGVRAMLTAAGIPPMLALLVAPEPPLLPPAPGELPPLAGAPGETPETADGQGGDPLVDAPAPAPPPPPPSRYIPPDALPARELAPIMDIPSRRLSLMAERGQIRAYIRLNGQAVYSRAEVMAAEAAANMTEEEREALAAEQAEEEAEQQKEDTEVDD